MRYLIVLLLLLAGVASAQTYRIIEGIDYASPPPADWPKLEERLTYADVDTVRRWCNKPGTQIHGCAVTSFRYGLCMVYLSNQEPALLDHERAHCAGYAHPGEAQKVRAAWEGWKQNQKVELLTQ